MMMIPFLLVCVGFALGGEPEVGCPAPRSPLHGQAFPWGKGGVRIVCDPGFRLVGREIVRCVEGAWEQPYPTCNAAGELERLQPTQRRPLFDWGGTEEDAGDGDKQQKQEDAGDGAKQQKQLDAGDGNKRAALMQNDKGDTYMRHLYYHNNYYYHQQPQQYGLTDSQYAWVLSLPPDLRDQYLRDMYRPTRYYYEYSRQPTPERLVVETPTFDYSCNRAGWPFVPAPKVPNAHVQRYDRRRHDAGPYLAAVYRCDPGYAPASSTVLYCSRRRWVGQTPRCVPR